MSEDRTHADILRAAAHRIADQGHFVMGALAWDHQGRQVDPLSPDAWRWNARGAIYLESGVRPTDAKETRPGTLYGFLDEAAWAICKVQGWHFPSGTDVADNLGHALTLQALEDAAVLAERESAS